MIKCILGTKYGDSCIRMDDGSFHSIYPDTSYKVGRRGYWMLQKIGDWWKIIKYLSDDIELMKRIEELSLSFQNPINSR